MSASKKVLTLKESIAKKNDASIDTGGDSHKKHHVQHLISNSRQHQPSQVDLSSEKVFDDDDNKAGGNTFTFAGNDKTVSSPSSNSVMRPDGQKKKDPINSNKVKIHIRMCSLYTQ